MNEDRIETPIASSISLTSDVSGMVRAPRLPEAIEEIGLCINELESRLQDLYSKLSPVLTPERAESEDDAGKPSPETSDLHNVLIRQIAWLNRMSYDLGRISSRIDL